MLEMEEFKHPEQVLLTNALTLAEKVHEKQYRKPLKVDPYLRIPYFVHPLRVALILLDELHVKEAETLSAAILHDVVEMSDGKITTSALEEKFGRTVALMVSVLSKPPVDKKIPRAQQLDTYHERIAQSSLSTRLVKLCDRTDNMRELFEIDVPDFQKKYLTETESVYLPLAETTDEYLHKELTSLCQKLKKELAQK